MDLTSKGAKGRTQRGLKSDPAQIPEQKKRELQIIIGKYIQVIVEETKNRPMYIVEDTININKSKVKN